eukprot:2246720-Amphidinium_carterae.1
MMGTEEKPRFAPQPPWFEKLRRWESVGGISSTFAGNRNNRRRIIRGLQDAGYGGGRQTTTSNLARDISFLRESQRHIAREAKRRSDEDVHQQMMEGYDEEIQEVDYEKKLEELATLIPST